MHAPCGTAPRSRSTTTFAMGGPKFVEPAGCITTPGQTVDIVVTELGVAVHPLCAELANRLRSAGVRTISAQELCAAAAACRRSNRRRRQVPRRLGHRRR